MEECPICDEKCILKELVVCKLEESKHKVCEKCHNKSNNNCWLCGDRIANKDIKVIEIEETNNGKSINDEPRNSIDDRMNKVLLIINITNLSLIFAGIIGHIYCKTNNNELCVKRKGIGYFFDGLILVTVITLIIIISYKCYKSYKRNQK